MRLILEIWRYEDIDAAYITTPADISAFCGVNNGASVKLLVMDIEMCIIIACLI